jgi:hypothetical protein
MIASIEQGSVHEREGHSSCAQAQASLVGMEGRGSATLYGNDTTGKAVRRLPFDTSSPALPNEVTPPPDQ